jgi:hypothetical protein
MVVERNVAIPQRETHATSQQDLLAVSYKLSGKRDELILFVICTLETLQKNLETCFFVFLSSFYATTVGQTSLGQMTV